MIINESKYRKLKENWPSQSKLNKFEELTKDCIPVNGKSDSLYGEIGRAISRIVYRYYNDGDYFTSGYGNETAGSAATFLLECGLSKFSDLIKFVLGLNSDQKVEKEYESVLHELVDEFLDLSKDVISTLKNRPTKDMFDSDGKKVFTGYPWDESDDEYEDEEDYDDEEDY